MKTQNFKAKIGLKKIKLRRKNSLIQDSVNKPKDVSKSKKNWSFARKILRQAHLRYKEKEIKSKDTTTEVEDALETTNEFYKVEDPVQVRDGHYTGGIDTIQREGTDSTPWGDGHYTMGRGHTLHNGGTDI